MNVLSSPISVNELKHVIEAGFEQLGLGEVFPKISEYVRQRMTSGPEQYLPGLDSKALEEVTGISRRLELRTLAPELQEMEKCLAYYLALTRLECAPRTSYLMRASSHCGRAQMVRSMREASRRRGGQQRHLNNHAAKQAAIDAFSRDPQKYRGLTPSKTAKLLYPVVREVVILCRLAMTQEHGLVRTIRGWLTNDPAVSAAFFAIQSQ